MGRGLAYKRHQEHRVRQRAIRYHMDKWFWIGRDYQKAMDNATYTYVRWYRASNRSGGYYGVEHRKFWVEDRANNMKCCFCWMCGNVRRHHGQLTMQENRALLEVRDYEQDVRELARWVIKGKKPSTQVY